MGQLQKHYLPRMITEHLARFLHSMDRPVGKKTQSRTQPEPPLLGDYSAVLKALDVELATLEAPCTEPVMAPALREAQGTTSAAGTPRGGGAGAATMDVDRVALSPFAQADIAPAGLLAEDSAQSRMPPYTAGRPSSMGGLTSGPQASGVVGQAALAGTISAPLSSVVLVHNPEREPRTFSNGTYTADLPFAMVSSRT